MKTKKILFAIITSLIIVSAFGQAKVALHSNGTVTIFGGANPFTDAYTASQHGDTIYLPGANLPYPSNINKSLVIFGAGHHPDSSIATNRTILNGNLSISENADSLHLEGIYLTGQLSFSTSHKVDNVVLKRNRIGSINYNGSGGATACENNQIIECIIDGDMYFNNAKSSLVSNSFIGARLYNGIEIGFNNNLLFYDFSSSSVSYYTIINMDNCYFSNNIFLRSSYSNNVHSSCELSTFTHNVFRGTPSEGSNTFEFNYYDINLNNFFVNQTGFAFSYEHDYNLLAPATYQGNDSTQVGVYGGFFPFKSGSIPSNPHIQSKIIAPKTNSSGELNIQIQVEAQDE